MITAYFFDKNLVRQGVLPLLGGTVVIRNNDLSTGVLDIDGNSPAWDGSLELEGGHVLLIDGDTHLVSGKLTGMHITKDQGVADITLNFTCHLIYLHRMISLPSPDRAVTSQNVRPYYTDKGPAETVIASMVRSHVGQESRVENRSPLTVDVSSGRGKQVSVNSRFKNLHDEVKELANAGGITYQTWIDGTTGKIRFSHRARRDLSRSVRLREDDGTLEKYSFSLESPSASRVLVAGQGEGVARRLKLIQGDATNWGEKGIVFQDRRDTDDDTELEQAGEGTLSDHVAKHSISIDTTSPSQMVFGKDFFVGDTISVQLTDRTSVVDVLQRVEFSFGDQGKSWSVGVGPFLEEPDESVVAPVVRKLRSDLRVIQSK